MTRVPVVERATGQLREGTRYILDRPRLMWVVVLAGRLGVCGGLVLTGVCGLAATAVVALALRGDRSHDAGSS